MRSVNVVVAQSDPIIAEHLAASLHPQVRSVAIARSVDELRHDIRKQAAQVAVVDMELLEMDELRELCLQFPSVQFVCTDRLPDESTWACVLEAGAVDYVELGDVRSIVSIARQTSPRSLAARAA